jgi:hypothetical protein
MEEDLGMTKKNNNADSALIYHNNNHNGINPLLSHPSKASSIPPQRPSSSWCSFPPPLQKQKKQHFPIDKGSDHYRYDNPWQQQQQQQQGQLYLRRENHHCRVLPYPVHHCYHVYHHNPHRHRSTIYDDGDYCGGVSFSKEQNRFVGLPVLSTFKSQTRQQQKHKHQEQQKCIDIGFTQQDGEALPPLPPQKQQQEKGYQQQQYIDFDLSKEEEEGQKQHQLQLQCIDISHSQEGNKPFAARPPPLLILQKQQQKQRHQKQGDATVEDDSQVDTTLEEFLPEDNAFFRINLHDEKWMGMFQKLITYKEQHENAKVPARYVIDLSFGNWVGLQRTLFNQNKMREDRLTLLNDIDFDWGSGPRQRVPWMAMYERLVVYKREHNGSTNGISSLKCDERLRTWISYQRAAYRRKSLSDDRISHLDTIGFDWNTMGRYTKRKVSSPTISSAAANTTNEKSSGEETTRRFINSDCNKVDMMPSPRKELCTSKNAMPVITKRSFTADYKIPATIGWSTSSSSLSSSVSEYSSHDEPVSDNVDNDRKEYDDDDDNGFIII